MGPLNAAHKKLNTLGYRLLLLEIDHLPNPHLNRLPTPSVQEVPRELADLWIGNHMHITVNNLVRISPPFFANWSLYPFDPPP